MFSSAISRYLRHLGVKQNDGLATSADVTSTTYLHADHGLRSIRAPLLADLGYLGEQDLQLSDEAWSQVFIPSQLPG